MVVNRVVLPSGYKAKFAHILAVPCHTSPLAGNYDRIVAYCSVDNLLGLILFTLSLYRSGARLLLRSRYLGGRRNNLIIGRPIHHRCRANLRRILKGDGQPQACITLADHQISNTWPDLLGDVDIIFTSPLLTDLLFTEQLDEKGSCFDKSSIGRVRKRLHNSLRGRPIGPTPPAIVEQGVLGID